jgi:hypothetical protein
MKTVKESERCECVNSKGNTHELFSRAFGNLSALFSFSVNEKVKHHTIKQMPLIKYIKEPYAFSDGFFNMKKMLAAANGKLLNKNGGPITTNEYIKSSIEMRKIGALVALKDENGTILIGWSQWNREADCDNYDMSFMINVAKGRAFALKDKDPKNIPFKVAEMLPNFIQRAKAYFKDGKMVNWATYIETGKGPNRSPLRTKEVVTKKDLKYLL